MQLMTQVIGCILWIYYNRLINTFCLICLDQNFNCSDSLENIINNVGFGSVVCSNIDWSGFEQLIDECFGNWIFDMTGPKQ